VTTAIHGELKQPAFVILARTDMLIWTEKFATGQPTIDEQHRLLIMYVNRLEALLVESESRSEDRRFMNDFVTFIENYIESHFRYEEQCMESYRCPAHQKNCQAHDQFRQMFRRFRERFNNEGARMELIMELNQTINAWIEGHILAVDTTLRPCLAKK
jgi:hemerythrin